jgi:hypothetical protein
MSTSHLKALVLGLAVLGYVVLIEVASYVLSRRFQALRIAQD